MQKIATLTLIALAFLACSREGQVSPDQSAVAEPAELDLAWLEGRQIYEPQLLFDDRGVLFLEWREKGEEGSDLYIARREDSGPFGAAVRINDEPGTVASYPHDEMRVALAAGDEGLIGVAWNDSRGQVRAAVSSDGATTFSSSIRLEQTAEAAYRGFPAIAFDSAGVLHAVWIDSRYAEGFAEEPADLYYATVADGVATEMNLTADQEATVCGCCRTFLEVTDSGVTRALFRNATADGYRDIFTVSGDGEEMSAPGLIGQPLWKINGCPMAGPIAVGDRVLWPDGSAGRKLLMSAGFDSAPAATLFSEEERGDWKPRLSPREVVSNHSGSPLVLLPGQSASRLLSSADHGDTWQVEADDLPRWATTAAYADGALLLLGSIDGELHTEQRRMAL